MFSLLYVFSLWFISHHSIHHYLIHLVWQPSWTQQSHQLTRKCCISCQPHVSVATFISRMAASQQTSTSAAVGEVAASIAKSIQSLTVAHAKHEELNNNAQAQVFRRALSAIESTQKDHEFQRVIEHVTVNMEHSRQEHLLKTLSKAQMADHPQQWEDHSADVRHFIELFKYFQGDFETLFNVSQGFDRYYIVLSESEFSSWSTCGWVKSPTESQKRCQIDQIRSFMLFVRSIDLETPSSHVLPQGGSWLHVQQSCGVSSWTVLHLLRHTQGKGRWYASHEVEFKKVKLHQFFKDHQIWAAQTELFSHNQSASSFMQSHVLYHESVSVSSWFMSETIVDIIQNTQIRLTERMLKIIRSTHPHMENLLFSSSGELNSNITEIDIDRSFTVVVLRVNPWELKESSSMEVEESVLKRGKESNSNSGSAILTFNSWKITFSWVSSGQTNLCGSQLSTSNSMSSFSESAWSNVSTHHLCQLKSRMLSSSHEAARSTQCRGSSLQQRSVSRYSSSLTHWLKSKEAGCHTYSESSCRLSSRHCHVSHAQMHGDFKCPNPHQ